MNFATELSRCNPDLAYFNVVLVDIWDGTNDEPVICHGYTLTSKILVKDVLQAVRDYAFVQSPCVFLRCQLIVIALLPPPRRLCFLRCLSVCLSAILCRNFERICVEIFREGWHRASEQQIKFWWLSRSRSRYRDCFPDSILLGDTESWTVLQL